MALFDATSIQEEDIIEICVWLGHTHPKGVLRHSAMESVILFHSADDMLVVAWGVIKVTTSHEEAIKVRTSPPSAAHVRAYMVVVDGEPSGSQYPTPDREGNLQHSPHDCHPGGSTPCQLQANLGDLGDDELWQLMEDLHQEVTLRELEAPPETHHQHLGKILWEMRILMWMTERSPFWEGKGGNPQNNHFDPLPLHNQMKDGNPEGNLLTTQHLLSPVKIWDALPTHWPWDCNLVTLI